MRDDLVPGESLEVRDMVTRAEELDALFDAASKSLPSPSLGPGIHYDVPRDVYHADPCGVPSFSHSIARLLLDRSPAHAWAHHPKGGRQQRAATPEMDEGTILDSLLLGGDQPLVESPFDDYRTKEARIWRDAQQAAGLLPVKRAELARMRAAAERIKANFRALRIDLEDPALRKQVTVVWDDALVRCRARTDALRIDEQRGCALILDLKRTGCAAGDAVSRSCVTFGYDLQWAAYTSAIEAVRPDLAGRVEMEFLFAETEPPYQVRLAPLAGSMKELGRHRWRRALRIWRECLQDNRWPGYDCRPLEAPQYAISQMEREQFEDAFGAEGQ